MITRIDAVETLYELTGSGIIDGVLEKKLIDIANCIEAELIGRHEWGVDRSELAKLYGATRADLVTDEDIKEYDRVHRKLTFIPSVDERIVIETAVRDKIEDSTGEEVTVEEINEWFARL